MSILDHFESIEEFEQVLEQAEVNAKTNWEMQFVDDLSNRFTQFAENTNLSEAQASSLRRIAGED